MFLSTHSPVPKFRRFVRRSLLCVTSWAAHSVLTVLTVLTVFAVSAEEQDEEERDIRFAFYSAAWGENANEAIRLVAYNNTTSRVRLRTINFQRSREGDAGVDVSINLEIPAQRYAEVLLPYIDLLSGDDCVDRTVGDDWKLVEISNYTLNPSVRNLIIEDTGSFRIYQCEQSVSTSWVNLDDEQVHQHMEWVLYHFETRPSL